MNELFGVPMNYIAAACVAVTALILGLVAFLAWRNPVMFKMGLRNIPRRKAQTSLIVVGLMLSTLIMSAAFGTGDTLSSSVTNEVYAILGRADEVIVWDTNRQAKAVDAQTIPLATIEQWRAQYQDDPDIAALIPYQNTRLPIQDTRTRLNESAANIVGFRTDDAKALGGLKDVHGNPVSLSDGEIAVNKDLAEQIDAAVGDTVTAFYNGQPIPLTVKAIVPNLVLSGAFDTDQKRGGAVDFATLTRITGKGENADGVFISNHGDVKSGLEHSDSAVAKLKATLAGSPYKVQAFKKDNIRFAQLIGSAFTAIFVVFGLFSIAAGILLIFLIFVMLAAERKPEMGMARAVGAKRRQLVESFLAEGMGYDLGSAVVGLVAGMGVTIAMVAIIKSAAGDNLGLALSVTFTPRSMVVAFCLGLIATFLVIFLSSWRASRLNIVSAIRDLPESPPIDPESATLPGYLRAVLNGMVAMALPLGASLFLLGTAGMLAGVVLGVLGLVSLWFYHLRGTNVAAPAAHRTNEGAPRWPWMLGLAVPVIGWFLILPWYFVARLLVRVVRDRKPARVPSWLLLLGIALPPIGFAVALGQHSRARISWSAGAGAALGLTGIVLAYAGLDRGSAFFFYLGLALISLWIAVTLRYFRIHERSTFTTISAFQLALWYLGPAGKLTWLTGKLDGGIEMFFLSGLVMVACAVFIVVYNADIVLPLVARVGSRYGRIVPAIKTGVAYPLTSRFRTGMTMMMIGLIMFALIVQATLNSNFSALFLNSDTRGGFDVQVLVNGNNRIDDITTAAARSGADGNAIRAAGEVRIAYPFEAEVQNKDLKQHNGKVEEYSRYTLFGADEAFLRATTLPMKARAAGYASDRAIWDAMAADPKLAVLDAAVTIAQQDFGGPPQGDNLLELNPVTDGFAPFTLNLRDPGTGTVTTITVIGQAKEAGDTFWRGIILRKETLLTTFPGSRGQAFYVALNPGTNAKQYARSLESGLVQVSADSLQQILDDRQKLQSGFLLVFQGFMGLGLIVGIAALGVVASRAVVERRQQIGMLRAIGYQRSMVALSFLFESGFIAVSGILIGLTLGLSLAWVLFTNGAVGNEGSSDVPFVVPWGRIGIVCAIAFAASMLMTYLPARSASHVAVAEALRYE